MLAALIGEQFEHGPLSGPPVPVRRSLLVVPMKTVTTIVEVVRPSLAVIVIVAWPCCPGAAVIVSVRLAPLPPRTIPVSGSRLRFEELAGMAIPAAAVKWIVPLAAFPTPHPP